MMIRQVPSWKRGGLVLILILCLTVLLYGPAYARTNNVKAVHARQPGAVDCLVVGDWGEENTASRSVSQAMAQNAATFLGVDFVISAGDHFYSNGVEAVTSPRFHSGFEGMYHQASLNVPWYLVLGNHDCRGSVQAQLDYTHTNVHDGGSAKVEGGGGGGGGRWTMPDRYYLKDVELSSGVARLIFLDTCSIACYSLDEVYDTLGSHEAAECMPLMHSTRLTNRTAQLLWFAESLDEAARDPTVSFILTVGHHPIFSNGPHGSPPVLRRLLLPLLLAHEKMLAYICGHDHSLQHIRISALSPLSPLPPPPSPSLGPAIGGRRADGDVRGVEGEETARVNDHDHLEHTIHQLVSGGGGARSHSEPAHDSLSGAFPGVSTVYTAGTYGFLRLSLRPGKVRVRYLSERGVELHKFTLSTGTAD